MPDFDKLQEHVGKLNALLAKREPGLGSWCMFVGEHWKAISEMWGARKRSDEEVILLNACRFVKSFLTKLEDGTRPDDPLRAVRKKFHAPLHAVLDNAIAAAALTASTEPTSPVVDQTKENE